MSLLSLFAVVVFAAETIVSPIPDGTPVVTPAPAKPDVSFGQIIVPSPTPTPIPTAVPTPAQLTTKKRSYTIAFLGDSMIDTLGPGLPAVQTDLNTTYPSTNFTLLNYGVGGTNIEYGIQRITSSYDYLGKHISALADSHPDIVVLESFGYNPFPVANSLDRYWLDLSHAVDTLRASIPGVKIVIAATIAPNASVFGDGVLAWNPQQKQDKVTEIDSYIENAIKFAQSQHLPLVDAYHASGASIQYINPGDHIHYSDAGRALFASKIVATITKNGLFNL